MKKLLPTLITFFFFVTAYSQITFEQGYFINNENKKIECLIKNLDWKNNPTEFEYKETQNSSTKIGNINTIKEFGIYNFSKYLRATVNIDASSENLNYLSTNRLPNFKEETLFLKVLINGDYNLYQYASGKIERFFFNDDKTNIEQLIFKTYLVENNIVKTNNRYLQQLYKNLKCSSINENKVKKVKYKKTSLINFFMEYNKCKNGKYVNFKKTEKKDLFNLTLRPRLNISSLSIQRSPQITDFGSEFGFGFGLEAEFILNFNKNKWSVLVEPTFQSYQGEVNNKKADYKSIEVHTGLRYYFFLNKDSKIFFNGLYVLDYAINSKVDNLDIRTNSSFGFGIGYTKNDKYSIELRHIANRRLLADYAFYGSKYNTFSFVFGYNLF